MYAVFKAADSNQSRQPQTTISNDLFGDAATASRMRESISSWSTSVRPTIFMSLGSNHTHGATGRRDEMRTSYVPVLIWSDIRRPSPSNAWLSSSVARLVA